MIAKPSARKPGASPPRRDAAGGARDDAFNPKTPAADRSWRLTSDYEILTRDLLLLPEASIIGTAAFVSSALLIARGHGEWSGHADGSVTTLALIAALLSPLIPRGGRPARPDQPVPLSPRAASLALPIGLLFLLVAVGGSQILPGGMPPASFMLTWAALSCLCLMTVRALFTLHLKILRRRGVLRERVAIVWCGETPEDALDYFPSVTRADIDVVGMFHASFDGRSNYPTINDLTELARRAPVDRVLVITKQLTSTRLQTIAGKLKTLDAEALLCFEGAGHGEGPIAGSMRMELIRRPLRGWDKVLKAAQDRFIVLLSLPLTLPAMALIALAIRIDSPGPVLFRQTRHGKNDAEFQIFKFRTMVWKGAAEAAGARQTTRGDSRITRIGGFLRMTSLDELPQIFNVLRGEMSIVGPRPHPVLMRTEDRLAEDIAPAYPHRHRVKPGLTGLAQINGSRGAMETAEQVRHRVEHDLRYIENWSLSLDLEIIALTPVRLVRHGDKAF